MTNITKQNTLPNNKHYKKGLQLLIRIIYFRICKQTRTILISDNYTAHSFAANEKSSYAKICYQPVTLLIHVMDVFSHWVVFPSKNVPGAQGITVNAWFVQREYTSQR